ncbi:hypothetical protein TNCV_4798601 [Trichonephila clavipes]|nr:hypothetical protein TNCV_4798601 [Trichonephila clavipes]
MEESRPINVVKSRFDINKRRSIGPEGFVPGVHGGNLVDRHAMRSEKPPSACMHSADYAGFLKLFHHLKEGVFKTRRFLRVEKAEAFVVLINRLAKSSSSSVEEMLVKKELRRL